MNEFDSKKNNQEVNAKWHSTSRNVIQNFDSGIKFFFSLMQLSTRWNSFVNFSFGWMCMSLLSTISFTGVGTTNAYHKVDILSELVNIVGWFIYIHSIVAQNECEFKIQEKYLLYEHKILFLLY